MKSLVYLVSNEKIAYVWIVKLNCLILKRNVSINVFIVIGKTLRKKYCTYQYRIIEE